MNGTPKPRLRALVAAVAAFLVAASVLVAVPATAESTTVSTVTSARTASTPVEAGGIVKTADLSQFRAGNIISDAVFTDTSTMSAAQIDSFFRSKVSTCQSGYTCLKDYRQNTPNRSGDQYCNGYTGGSNESAATIIYKVAQSCGINPQVFIVMLQKEQGLVTHTWPSDWRYTMALGQGCPDTAPCDPNFAGFFYQIYGAGRQMNIYTEGRYFTYYAPGKTWNILYNPNSACGRGPVYIENASTAALYYYTPYQPNAAALRAGYGTGDSCSAYGNRNFYNYFTDWFGSTQAPATRLIKASTSNEIYLLAESRKYHITSSTDLAAYMAQLGWYQTVTSSYIASIPNATVATRFVRDSSDGGMYLLEPDGSKHHFTSADAVTRFGFSMSVYTSLPASVVKRFPTGANVGTSFTDDVSDPYYRWENGAKRHIVNAQAWSELPVSDRSYVATLPAANVAAIPNGPSILPSRTLVREASSPDVYLTGVGPEIVHIPTWGVAYDAGVKRTEVLADGALAANPRVNGDLAPFLQCAGTVYAVDGGAVTRVLTKPAGAPIVSLPESICSALPKTGRSINEALFAQTPGSDPVYLISGTQLRHVRSQARLQEANGNRALYFFSWSADTRKAFTTGAPLLADKSFVSFGTDEIFYVEAGKIRHVQSSATLIRLASPSWPSVEKLAPEWRSAYAVGTPIP
ncbi:hypothetical protein ACI3KS_10745 [Microbacterium sp. ZW T5_45]|uniref:hypothetical protein n=1 Tax=Microbacterium sp. ZW T5_45 TaxID=3378080 RepID=UPI0038535065